MKTSITIILLSAILALAYHSNSFVYTKHESAVTGTKISFPAEMIVSTDNSDILILTYPKPSTGQIQLHYLRVPNLSLSLSQSISKYFLASITDEQSVRWGREGISFYWKGPSGDEKAFAFRDQVFLYVVTTIGADKNGSMYKDLERITSSLKTP